MAKGPEDVAELESIKSKCVKNTKTTGYVAPKEKACEVMIGGQHSSVLTRRATPTQIAMAAKNAVWAFFS